ncbi:transcription elongation factor spt4 [Leucoagaricus gongylophorus]
MSAPIPPQAKSRNLRACLLCSIVLTPSDFRKLGCPNCEDVMQLKGSPDRIASCTTTSFEGTIAGVSPENSWVSRWQRTTNSVRGIYGIHVRGRVPEDVEAELESRGIKYRPRDQSDQD